MDTTPAGGRLPPDLRFLKWLVIVLTLTLIAGVITIVALLVIRLSPSAPISAASPTLPAEIRLPDGARPVAVTMGGDWYAIVTGDDEILIYDKATGALRQSVQIKR